MLSKALNLFWILLFTTTIIDAQIVVDSFDSTASTTWVSGSTKIILTNENGYLKVQSKGTGAAYEGFGNYAPVVDMSVHSKLKFKVMIPKDSISPLIRIDLCDNAGIYTNGSVISFKPVADSLWHEYEFDFAGKFYSTYPSSNTVNPKKIVRYYIYFNPGGANFKGTVYFDDFIVPGAQSSEIIKSKGNWKYFDKGTEPSAEWTSPNYKDTAWKQANAPFGYGFSNNKTTIYYGQDVNNKYITTYFRKQFNIVDTSTYKNLIINLKADDGAIVYLNGNEVARYNMPLGKSDNSTLALTEKNSSKDSMFQRIILPETLLVMDTNVLAVEIHQASVQTADMLFDASLTATDLSKGLIRCPYLQKGSETGILIRWRTLENASSRACYGTSPNNLNSVVDSSEMTTEHKIQISNLKPNTKYYYCIGDTKDTLAGADTSHYFVTAPVKGTEMPIRIWALGDAGYAIADQRNVRNAYYKYIGSKHTNFWLILGDNAYSDGKDDEYQIGMFENMFEKMLAKSSVWATPGNHDIRKYRDLPYTAPYYSIFDMPQKAECGGIASNNPGYYSFDYGNIHVISLETNHTPRYDTSAMAEWLKKDLAANTSRWTLAFMHHPPYSKGSHNADDTTGEDLRCTETRKYLVPILEKGGVDFVITGHSHVYERSYMIHGQYDSSGTFLDEPHVVNAQISGRRDSNEVYIKNPKDQNYPNYGTVYNVMGCSGFIESTIYWVKQPNNLITNSMMYTYSNKNLGSMLIEVNKDTLTARFIDKNAIVRDYYSIVKDETKQITLIKAKLNKDLHVGLSENHSENHTKLSIYPNPAINKLSIEYNVEHQENVVIEILNTQGIIVNTVLNQIQSAGLYSAEISCNDMPNGVYIISVKIGGNVTTKQLIVTE